MRALAVFIPFAVVAFAELDCGGSKDAVNPPPPPMPSATATYSSYPPPPPSTTGTALPPPPPTSSTQATPIPAAAAAAAAPVLAGLAASEAPGMTPTGQVFAGNFQEGQTLEQTFAIEAGKCYTIIGAGLGITQLDVSLVLKPLPSLPGTPLANTTTPPGPTAVVGGRAVGCWKNPTPLGGPGVVIVKAVHGSGMAAAQIFSK